MSNNEVNNDDMDAMDDMDDKDGKVPFPSIANQHFQGDQEMLVSPKKRRLKGTRDRARAPNFSTLKEYIALNNYSLRDQNIFFDVVSRAVQGDTWEFLELEMVQQSINEVFYYLRLVKRFRQLSMLGVELTYSEEGFHLGESIFETLDAVEKAIKNKAFL